MSKLQDAGFALEGVLEGEYVDPISGHKAKVDDENEPIYGDLEVEDFNKLFRNEHLIKDKFGQSISVKLHMGEAGSMTRHVTEDLRKVVTDDNPISLEVDDPNEMSMAIYSQAAGALSAYGGDDHDFDDLDMPKFNYTTTDITSNHDLLILHTQLQSFRKPDDKAGYQAQSVDQLCTLFV